MKKLLKIFAVMFIVSVALLAVAAYVPNGDVADAVTADCTHEYSKVVLAQQPSCTQEGWLEHYTCTLCEKYFVKVGEDMVEVDREDISSPVLVHKWSDWFVKPATCTEEGGEMRYCALCGATEHRGETIDATGHNFTHHEAVASTCTDVGTKAHYECSVCHKLFVDGESGKVEVSAEELVIPTTEHTVVVDKAVEPTCTETGLTEGSHCSVCGTVLVAQQVIPVTGHTVVTDEEKAPTCTETGLKEGSHCSVCNEVLVAQQEIPATGHTYDAVTTRNNVCTVCEYEITQAEIVEKLYALESGKALDGTYLLTGIVTNIDDTNATIIVEEKVIYLYSFQSTDEFLVGDSVSVVGTLKHFGNYYEFDKGTVTEVTHPEYTLTFGVNVEGYKVTLANGSPVPTSATNGTTYEVKITVPSGYKVASVTVNGTVVDMSESGTYSVTVCGVTTVHVEIVSKMFSGMVLEATADSLGLKGGGYDAEGNNGVHDVNGYGVSTYKIYKNNSMQWQAKNGTLTVTGSFTRVEIKYSTGTYTLTVDNKTIEKQSDENNILVFDLGTSTNGIFTIKVGSSYGLTEYIRFYGIVCEHEWGDWTSNGNNTHTGKCSLCGEKVTENCTFVDGVCSVCNAQEVITHSVTVGYTVNGNAATTLPEGVTVEILGEDGQSVTDLANVVEGTTLKVKITAEGFDIAVTCNSESLTLQDGEGAFVVDADVTLSVTLTTQTDHAGTAEDPYSVADALAIAGAMGQGNYTEKVYIKGLVIDAGENKGNYLSNIYIADTADGTKMLVFSANFSEEVPSIYEGDTVVFHGYITNYNGILEIAGKEIAGKGKDYPVLVQRTVGTSPITAEENENVTVTLSASQGENGSEFSFTIAIDTEGYTITSVTANGKEVTADEDGTYRAIVEGPTVVIVVGRVEGTSPTAFVKITDQNTFENAVASGAKFLIVYEDGNTAYVFDGSLTKLDAANNYVTATIENGQIADSAELQASSFAITASASGYNIQSASGYYIGPSSSNGMLSNISKKYDNSISFSSSNVIIKGTATTIKFNNASDQMRFRYYKSGQKSVCLYALI